MMFNLWLDANVCLIFIVSSTIAAHRKPWISISAPVAGGYNGSHVFIQESHASTLNWATIITPREGQTKVELKVNPIESSSSFENIATSPQESRIVLITTTETTVGLQMTKNNDNEDHIRWPWPEKHEDNFDHTFNINRTLFTENLIWKLHENNETNAQITLNPIIKDSLPELSQIQIHFNSQSNDRNPINYKILNFTYGPMIEVKTQSLVNKSYEEPIIEIRINKTKYNIIHNEHKWICVYWNENDRIWKSDGLQTLNSDQFITCLSTHLTLFSVLLDPYSEGMQTTLNEHEKLLTILSIVGSLITIPCVLLTIRSYCCRKSLESETTKILLHSCVALLFTHISYQAYHWLGERTDCRVINFMTHYSVAAFLLWAASDGVNMWRMLFNDIFNTKGHYFYLACKILSWGFPLLTTSAGVFVTEYTPNKCQLYFKQPYEILLYILPCTLILCSNLLFFVWMIAKVFCKNSLRRLHNKKIEYIVALAQVFNIVWCISFPLLWFSETRLLGQYLIAILVSAQGVLILVVRCGKDSELKQRVLQSFCVQYTASLSHRILIKSSSSQNYSVSKSSELHERQSSSS